MAILKIARMGHPVLRRVADPVTDPTAPDVAALVQDMLETLVEYEGVGLAAPQVHVSRRVVLVGIPKARAAAEAGEQPPDEPEEDGPPTVLINPVVEPLSEDRAEGWEACLSVPEMAGFVPRHTHIRYTYQTLTGEQVTAEAKDFTARVLQHEIDHLDGILYPMRMTDMTRFGFVKELQHSVRGEEVPDGD